MQLKILFALLTVLCLAGCAASRREMMDIQTQQFEMRIRQLEKDTQQKDKKIHELENELKLAHLESERARGAKPYPEKMVVTKKEDVDISKITPKRIQSALKNAGFYNGSIDGKIGKETKKAIKDFQKANGLNADGIIGRKTWAKLQKYLD